MAAAQLTGEASPRLVAAALLKHQFLQAVQHVKSGLPSAANSDNATKLQFYALFKFIHHGQCSEPEPSSFDFTKHAKWYAAQKLSWPCQRNSSFIFAHIDRRSAYHGLNTDSKADAMREYVALVCGVDPTWSLPSV
jgi:acyl-CoA-binding protein